MSILHLLRSSGFSDHNLQECLNALQPNDALVLIDDGVYNLQHPKLTTALTQQSINTCYVITEHLQARAVNNFPTVKTIAIAQLIELNFLYHTVLTWQ